MRHDDGRRSTHARSANRRRFGSAIDALVCKDRNQVLFKIQIFLEGMTMETRIKHVAICTENYDRMAEFYKSVFGMKKITNGMTDATGNYNPERGHISDG